MRNETNLDLNDLKEDQKGFNFLDCVKINAQLYNKILPSFLCPHCGLILSRDKIWDKFKTEEKKSLNLDLFQSLWTFSEKGMLKLYMEDFKSLRYCCKMVVLDAFLNIKRVLKTQLEKQNSKLVDVSKVLTQSNKEQLDQEDETDFNDLEESSKATDSN